MACLHNLARLSLATTLLLVLTTGNTETQSDLPAGMGARANVDRPKPTFMLHERDKRVHGLKPFQDLVDRAEPGSVLKPPPGVYAGPVSINKPLTIDGGGKVTIDSGDRGTVMMLNASNSVVRGLHLTGSGDSHDTDDSCLDVKGDRNTIENIQIDNCLFGLDLKQSNNNVIRGNSIRSKDRELGVRGDGLRLWYSNGNLIEKNQIIDSRDMVAWYSHKNVFQGNLGKRSRYSIHFMFANDNVVERNEFYDNAVGVYFMYTEGGVVKNNIISHATGATGMGIGFKEASGTIIENNEIIYCGVGIGSDLSPFQPDSTIEIRGNRFAYNGIGILFNSETGGNNMLNNVFEGNLTQVSYGGHGDNNNSPKNVWIGNYWDDYQGFDRNGDGIGDKTHELYAYADQIWMELPIARFFRSSPVMELLDFLERLAPFSTPDLILRDEKPRFVKPARIATS
ncbi:nitrous oxide reductase family maturation protein NosD [Ferribacterium limneticum]|uniref:nitrous oxide reductase family maturation protein NosD n=1 Tax=Ferribacterium limneticum TaxID=76259 RepID=UPI001CFA68B4|nr:nitrous oxide reductase family maturation protein NosD [Ferribacterium limneticum]UCV27133.1 nitrous oxide reductase family maturation protein NosD [Ferribacterium limneticum]UCV31050.1 nitrous oxide reductase family maturation protein NosD [Ferribacterium limneticum]